MFQWQLPKWLSKISLEAGVLLGSGILHAFLLIAIFVVYQDGAHYDITMSGSMINSDAEIVFMPLHRSIKQPTASTGAGVKKNGTSTAKVASAQKDEPGTTIVKITQAKPKPKAKKESRTNGSTSSPRAVQKKTVDKKDASVGNKNKSENLLSKKNKSEEKANPARPDPSASSGVNVLPVRRSLGEGWIEGNERNKQEASSQKTEEMKPEPAKTTDQKVSDEQSSSSSDATCGASDNIVYVGQEEMDSLQAQEYIRQELAQHWAPPAGMRSDLVAIIILVIDFEGIIKQVELTKASGNLLFDTAAKKAAACITPARWAYGKKLAITFKP